MHNKDLSSRSSKGGFGVGVNTADSMQANSGTFASSSSSRKEKQDICVEVEAQQKENEQIVNKELQNNQMEKRFAQPHVNEAQQKVLPPKKEPFTTEQNDAIKDAFAKNPKVTVAALLELPLLKGKKQNSVKTRLWKIIQDEKKGASDSQIKGEQKIGEKKRLELAQKGSASASKGKKPQSEDMESVMTLVKEEITLAKDEILEKNAAANEKIFELLNSICIDLKGIKEEMKKKPAQD